MQALTASPHAANGQSAQQLLQQHYTGSSSLQLGALESTN